MQTCFVIVGIYIDLCLLSFYITLANSEMSPVQNRWFNLGLLLFEVFKWPTLFFYQGQFSIVFVIIGLAANSVFYTLLLERVIFITILILKKTPFARL